LRSSFGRRNEGQRFLGRAGGCFVYRGVGSWPRAREVPARLDASRAKGELAMIYGEPETPGFLAAVQRLNANDVAKNGKHVWPSQRVRVVLRKMREC